MASGALRAGSACKLLFGVKTPQPQIYGFFFDGITFLMALLQVGACILDLGLSWLTILGGGKAGRGLLGVGNISPKLVLDLSG